MEWNQLRDNIYYVDGSLRDIYIQNTTKEDWILWANYVNNHYKISFFSASEDVSDDKINISKVFDYWNGEDDYCLSATIFLGNILVKIYFFSDAEIENNIKPNEINSIDDHLMVVDYMNRISILLGKKVILTPENYSPSDQILIETDHHRVLINV